MSTGPEKEDGGVPVTRAVWIALGAAGLAYGFFRFWISRGRALPDATWLTVAVIVLIAALVTAGGWQIRQYRAHNARRMPVPQQARRILVAGQSSALVGAALTGWYGGQAAVTLHNLGSSRVRELGMIAAACSVAAFLLCVVGFVVQEWCRIDDDSAGDDDQPPVTA